MVVLAASICTRSGKPLLSRQFRPIPRSRVDGLLASFPKLIPANSQHTTVETNDVRFVYQPFEELYVLLITNKGSNILQDINTLQLLVRLISSLTPAMSEAAILHHSFDLLCAFDEVVSLGYKEQVTLSQVRSVLEGESHEEKIQEIIARNKEAEAKEELKRRAKQLEMQRREQQRIAQASRHGGGGHGLGGMAGGYSPVSTTPRFEQAQHEYRTPSPAPAAAPSKPAFRGSGMKLGGKKGKNDLLSALGHEAEVEPEPEPIHEPEPEPVVAVSADVLPEVEKEEIHVLIKEQLDVTLLRDGGLKEFELKGELQLQHSNPDLAKVKLELASEDLSDVQFKQHPSLAKFAGSGTKVVALKDASRSFPPNVSVLRWRLVTKDESKVPLTVTVWPQPRGDGTSDVAIEYELEASHLTLRNVVISIPIPDDALPVVTGDGNWQADRGFFTWTIDEVDANEPSGSLEFRSEGDADSFFPVNVGFAAVGSLANVGIATAKGAADGSEIVFSQEQVLTVDKYEIV
ncbi:coatomer subunit delta [Vanrija albida]|uniref:Coatomer subunit delta n=1 Tax=Vanrija albida TaxID=181172 RepID=A0ABR3Q182_9TREE